MMEDDDEEENDDDNYRSMFPKYAADTAVEDNEEEDQDEEHALDEPIHVQLPLDSVVSIHL
jgi:hypothetical protein